MFSYSFLTKCICFHSFRLRKQHSKQPEDHWSCIADLSAEDVLKSAVIEEKKFKHSPSGRGKQPILTKILMSTGRHQTSLSWSFVASLKRISSTFDFINIFSWFIKCIGQGRQPQGTQFWCQQKPLVTLVVCYKFKNKSLWSLILYIFHEFIHAYSPGAGADNPLGTKFWCQQEPLVTSVICCKFQTNLFEVWFYTFFSWFNLWDTNLAYWMLPVCREDSMRPVCQLMIFPHSIPLCPII